MDEFLKISTLEQVVAYFFGVTALLTLVLATWAYIYQKRASQNSCAKKPLDGEYGEFFIRR